jgi:hypothetical protein
MSKTWPGRRPVFAGKGRNKAAIHLLKFAAVKLKKFAAVK